MKILHVTESLGGGVQSAISKYTHLTSESEHFIYGKVRDGESTGEYSEGSILFEFRGTALAFIFGVRNMIKDVRPDVVHIHSSLAGLARLLVPINLPVLYSPHCYAFERTDKGLMWRKSIRFVESILALRPQVTIAVSPHEANLAKKLYKNSSVFYVPNVLMDSSVKRSLSLRPTVVMVGRIGVQKDPSLFASVSKLLGHLYDFLWVGDGDTKFRNELIDSGVQVSGWQSPSEARKLVASSHLYFHSAAWEAAPISTIEAAASGVSVLARGISTMVSLGYFVTPSSAEEISVAINKYFTDLNYRDSVIERTSEVANRFTRMDAQCRLNEAYVYATSGSK